MSDTPSPLHAAILRFRGEPADLVPRYDALVAEFDDLLIHLCLVAPDGLVVVDTCPDEASWNRFIASGLLQDAVARHGLPQPAIEAHPVHAVHGVAARTAA